MREHGVERYPPALVDTPDLALVTVFGRSPYSGGRSDRAGLALGEMEEVTDCARACFMIFTLFFERGRRDTREAGRYGESNDAISALSGRGAEEEEEFR